MEITLIRPNFAKWQQTVDDILRLSLEADHRRSRERFQALYMIGSGQSNATQWAEQLGRKNQTVMNWVHKYNAEGPDSLHYRRTGGSLPLLPSQRKTT